MEKERYERGWNTCDEVNGYVPQVNVVDKVSKAGKNYVLWAARFQ